MPHNIVETAREAGTFQTLLTAVDAAGLGETLADGGPRSAESGVIHVIGRVLIAAA